jgi:putative membrane protein
MIAIVACVVMILAGCLHGYIFVLESFLWTRESTIKVFSIGSREEAEATREMAFNQGFYNLFLGLIAVLGSVVYLSGVHGIGTALMFAGALPMVCAAVVLFVWSPDKRPAALKQMAFPLIGCVLLLVSFLF